MLHPDARISATMQVKIQSHPGERWTVSCSALNKRDGRSLTIDADQVGERTRFSAGRGPLSWGVELGAWGERVVAIGQWI